MPEDDDARDLQLYTNEFCVARRSPNETGISMRAVLDTGNGGPTVIARRAAGRLGLLNERPLGHVRMTGVVEGAHETSPLVMLTYTLKGKTITRKACIGSDSMGCELLISRKDIVDFEREGYRLSAR